MIWTSVLYFLAVTVPFAALVSLALNPSWGSAAWLIASLVIGWFCVNGARERQRRRKPAHERTPH